jgi:hypothetical protein
VAASQKVSGQADLCFLGTGTSTYPYLYPYPPTNKDKTCMRLIIIAHGERSITPLRSPTMLLYPHNAIPPSKLPVSSDADVLSGWLPPRGDVSPIAKHAGVGSTCTRPNSLANTLSYYISSHESLDIYCPSTSTGPPTRDTYTHVFFEYPTYQATRCTTYASPTRSHQGHA